MVYRKPFIAKPWIIVANAGNRRRRVLLCALGLLFVFTASIAIWWNCAAPLKPGEQTSWYAWAPRKLKSIVVEAIGAYARSYIRDTVESQAFSTNLTPEQMYGRLFDESADPADRHRDAYRLSRTGTPESEYAINRYLANADAADRAATAQLLGAGGDARNKQFLLPLLDDPEPQVVQGAIRGLSAIGGGDVADRLSQYINKADLPEGIKIEAAAGLGTIGTPAAYDALVVAAQQDNSERMTIALLQGLSQFNFSPATEQIFRKIIDSPDKSMDLRVDAIEALSDCPAGAEEFVFEVAAKAEDWELRAGAAWGLSKLDFMPNGAGSLVTLAEKEADEVVRRRLYEAVIAHPNVPNDRLFDLAESETDLAARVAGFNAAAVVARRNPQRPELAQRFDANAIEELVETALSTNPENLRMRAVFALRRAQTPAAIAALKRISLQSEGAVADSARHETP